VRLRVIGELRWRRSRRSAANGAYGGLLDVNYM
jgi:hypothetical protein